MIIGYFGVEDKVKTSDSRHDRPYALKLAELIGAHNVKASYAESGADQYLASFAAKVRAARLDCAIVSDPVLLNILCHALTDYKPVYMKTGKEKLPTLAAFAGSILTIPKHKLGTEKDLEVLIIPPLEHLRTVPEAPFLFRRYISKLTKPDSWFPQSDFSWDLITPQNVQHYYSLFAGARLIAVDIETPENNPYRTIECVGYCGLFADGTTHSVVLPVKDEWAISWMQKFNALKPGKIMQNGLYDAAYFMRWNAPLYNWMWDTLILFHCWYAELPKDLGFITSFAIRNVRYWKDEGKTGNKSDKYEYNAKDCWATMMSFLSMMQECPGYVFTNYEIEFPLVFPCITVELDGIAADEEKFKEAQKKLQAQLETHENRLRTWVHPDFNPGSSKQCILLMGAFGYKWRTGQTPSSDDKNLNAVMAFTPLHTRIFGEIQKVREYRKLLTTYIIWEKIWNGRLYYKLNPAGTDTGRMASTESSFWCGLQIQNMPRGWEVKSWLRADSGWLLGENDFAQSEARCVGYISGCTTLIELVEGPHDYHSWNAQSFFGVPYDTIYDERTGKTLNKALRDLSKRTNHGANYNMGAQVMLDTMGPSAVQKAKEVLKLPANMSLKAVCEFLLNQYARTYPEVKTDYQDWIKRTVQLTHKLVSALGWTRYCFGDPLNNKQALNAYVAHVPQNLSVGIINRRFYQIWRETIYGSLRDVVRLKAQIHDSILYQYRIDRPDASEIVNEMMKEPIQVRDIKGKTRTLLIPPDVSAGKVFWSELK
jgi:hypothetical protein